MAGNTIDVNIQPHILAAINANKDLVDAANSPGVKKADKKKILAKTDEVSGRISTIQDLIDKHAISSEQAIKEIEGVFNTLSKATVSLMSYSKAVKSELIRINEEIQKKRDELQKAQEDYVNLKGNPNKIVYGGRQIDKDGNVIFGSEKSVEQYSLGKDDINTIVSQVAPDIGKPVNSKAALEKIASGEDSSVTDSKVIAEAADALNLVKAAQEQIRGILNDNLNLQVEINKAISEQQALSEKVNENANMTPGADQTALENLQIAYGNLQRQLEELDKKYKDLLASKSEDKDKTNDQVETTDELSDSYKKQDGVVNKAIKSFFGYQQVIRALRTVVNFTVKTITDLDKALTDQAIVSDLNRKQA
jgi:chromosome segregation ATPase